MQHVTNTETTPSTRTTHSHIFYTFAKKPSDYEIIDEVLRKYPGRITAHLKQLIRTSPAVARQYLPAMEELQSDGTATPFEEGKSCSSVFGLERVYRDRVLMTPHFDCPAYCRFCYKKSRVMRDGKLGMTLDDIDRAVDEVGRMTQVRGVLITGGDPLMDTEKLFYTLDKLQTLENVREIRIGTRCLLTLPEVFTPELCDVLASYNRPDMKNPESSRNLAINVHFNHPDELSTPETIMACNELRSRGIILRNQTVLLKGINDNIHTMHRLFSLLIRNNIIPYYMNHCMPVAGSDHLRTSIQRGLDIYRYLCTESSTIIPHYVYAPHAGKVHLGPDTQLNYQIQKGRRLVNVEMLYDAKEFRRITKQDLPPMHGVSPFGKIIGTYMDGSDE